MSIPAFHGNIDFNAQHSPVGAFFSFTCGKFGSRGGFGLQIGKPGNQDIFIGVKDGDRFSDAPLRCLPFFEGAGAQRNAGAEFLVEQASAAAVASANAKMTAFTKDQITRQYGWATDRWIAGELTFAIYTPFNPLPDPDPNLTQPGTLRQELIPAVVAELTIDNTAGRSPKTGVFAMRFDDPGSRMETKFLGFRLRNLFGVEATIEGSGETRVTKIQRWDVESALVDVNPVHMLGNVPGFVFEVPAGHKQTIRLAFCAYLGGIVTTGLEGRYLYSRHYASLDDVCGDALRHFDRLRDRAAEQDRQLLASKLSADQQFMIAHATRSYHGSTQLLDVGGEPFWIVNEGEYCMMNTLDLSVDQVFWELRQNPWVVKNLLDNFARHYSYVDELLPRGNETSRKPGGISFAHDMGIHNNFSPRGNSSYELPNLNAACFSYMTCEQLCNWSLIAVTYVLKTSDLAWAKQNQHWLRACVESLQNRGGEAGFVQFDSSRCGDGGAEITTYDSLDHSLAQTRNNVYMAVKCWASFYGLALTLEKLGDPAAKGAREFLSRIEREVVKHVRDDGVFPAVFEKDNSGYNSRILPAVEGLIYPLAWNAPVAGPMIDALRKHTVALLTDAQRRNLFADGGIKLSSTSNNSWMSKIAIFLHVAREVFGLGSDPAVKEILAKADAAHVKWQTDGSGYWACSDQFVSGVAQGSRYYPRIISSALWMK